mmetsp:Transcript_29659/g.45356  ORF Transcript_29659/g.45356 Transcript_29659/m.45356 type:complete len:636 (-) Transcript_29659:54-1961(-)
MLKPKKSLSIIFFNFLLNFATVERSLSFRSTILNRRRCFENFSHQRDDPNGGQIFYHGKITLKVSGSKAEITVDDIEGGKGRRNNHEAQNIFDFIADRYREDAIKSSKLPEWAKARRYIYHATTTKTALSVDQATSVLNFLDELFEHEKHGINAIFVIQSVPRILRKDPDNYLSPNVDFLKGLYNEEMFYEAIKRNPNLLLTSGVGFDSKRSPLRKATRENGIEPKKEVSENLSVEEYLTEKQLGISASQICKLKKTHPKLFQLSVSGKVQPIVEYLTSTICLSEDAKSKTLIGKMIKSNPNILNLSIANIQSKVEFLQECGFSSAESIGNLWRKYPSILSLSLEGNIRPTIHQLLRLLESPEAKGTVADQQLLKILSLHPQLLALSTENIDSKVSYFGSIDSLVPTKLANPNGLARRVVLSAPSVFSLSLESNIIPKVNRLAKLWNVKSPTKATDVQDGNSKLLVHKFNNSTTLSRNLSDYPSVLSLSLEGNIEPTIMFFNRTGYITVDEDGYSGNHCRTTYLPARYIATSLFNRLLPRYTYYIDQEAERQNLDTKDEVMASQAEDEMVSQLKPPLHILAGAKDEIFCKRMDYNHNLYTAFKEESIPRLKFSSQFATWLKTGRPIDDFDDENKY